jgi:hypothetical protein
VCAAVGSGDEATSWTTVANEEELQIVGELLQQRKEREALMAAEQATHDDTSDLHRASLSVAQSTALIQLLFPSSTARRRKQWLIIKQNDDKQKEQRTTVKTLLHILLRECRSPTTACPTGTDAPHRCRLARSA